jgi:hypothetical protein
MSAEIDPLENSAELEAELLKAATGPFTLYSSEEMHAACERVLCEKNFRTVENKDAAGSQ